MIWGKNFSFCLCELLPREVVQRAFHTFVVMQNVDKLRSISVLPHLIGQFSHVTKVTDLTSVKWIPICLTENA